MKPNPTAQPGVDATGIVQNIEGLLGAICTAQQHAQAALETMEAFPDLANEANRLRGILGVLGSLSNNAQASPLALPVAVMVPLPPLAPGEFQTGAPT